MSEEETPPTAQTPSPSPALRALIDGLAAAIVEARASEIEAADRARHVADVTGQLEQVATRFAHKLITEQQRKRAQAELERLFARISDTSATATETLANQRDAITQAIRNIDLSKIADGLQALAGWMRNPRKPEAPAEPEAPATKLSLVPLPEDHTAPADVAPAAAAGEVADEVADQAPAEPEAEPIEDSSGAPSSRSLGQLFGTIRKDPPKLPS